MNKPTIRIHNTQTDEVIDREMTDSEFELYQIELAENAAKKAEEQAKAVKRAELLNRLGITEEEARILLG